jgi:hypothetical protein
MPWEILDRMERAVAKVRERLLRSTAALNQAGVPYAVAGGHAVASWVATVDEGAVRNTRDVDLLVRREDPPASPDIVTADDPAGFRVLTFESLVRMKLLSNRDKDRTHVRDMISVGLIDRTWIARLPAVLAERLQAILDTPEG